MVPIINVCISLCLNNENEIDCFRKSLESLLDQKGILISLTILDNSNVDVMSNLELKILFSKFYRYFFENSEHHIGKNIQKLLNISDCDIICFFNQNVLLHIDNILLRCFNKLSNKNKFIISSEFSIFVSKTNDLRKISGFDFKFQSNRNIYFYVKDIYNKNKLNVCFDNYLFYGESFENNEEESILKNDTTRMNDKIYIYADKDNDVNKYPIIYIDGAMGDHIMALPLIRTYKDGVIVCSKFNQFYKNIANIKSFIDWNDNLFGGLGFHMYEYGSYLNKELITKAYSEMYGRIHNESLFYFNEIERDVLSNVEEQINNLNIKNKLVCISPFSSNNPNGELSNKNWKSTCWIEVIDYLQKLGMFVIQLGRSGDDELPTVNQIYFDKSFEQLSATIKNSELVIAVDSFVHHLSSAIGTKTICLTPINNEHAFHKNTKYIYKNIDNIGLTNKWMIDAQQSERKKSMNLINTNDVLVEVNNILLKDLLYNKLT
jgi:hypothetical protein